MKKSKPTKGNVKNESRKRGRPVEMNRETALENDDEQITISELVSMMENMPNSNDSDAYTTKATDSFIR